MLSELLKKYFKINPHLVCGYGKAIYICTRLAGQLAVQNCKANAL
jgi:hypothetical protein